MERVLDPPLSHSVCVPGINTGIGGEIATRQQRDKQWMAIESTRGEVGALITHLLQLSFLQTAKYPANKIPNFSFYYRECVVILNDVGMRKNGLVKYYI